MNMNEKEYDFKEYKQKELRDNTILKDVKNANETGRRSKFSEEQILSAQREEGKKAMNELYYEGVFPLINNILFMVYYISSLITLPLVYLNEDPANKIVMIIGGITLIIIWSVIRFIDKFVHKKKFRKKQWMKCLEKFSIDTSVFTYFLTSIGYMLVILNKIYFGYLYLLMCFVFIISVYYDIAKPLLKSKCRHTV